MFIGIILLAVVCALLLAVVVWLVAGRKSLLADRDRLATDLQNREAAIEGYLSQIEAHRIEIAQLQTRLEGQEDRFKSLAQDVLGQVNQQFQQWAVKTFQGEQKDATAQLEQRKQAIESLVKPVRESLERYQKSIQEIESARKQAYGSMTQHLQSLAGDQQLLRKETANLVTALRKPDVRGRWGEMQLRRVAELAGMIDHCDFTEQFSVTTDDGKNLRPDLIVHLPADRTIVVDAKTPLEAFLDAVKAEDSESHDKAMDRHVSHIRSHIKTLGAKKYADQFERAVDFVVMFIPGESFLQAAVVKAPSLIDDAAQQGVIIATPSTLIALLKAVAVGWREQQLAENAKHIAEAGKALHDRLAKVIEHAESVGSHLGKAVKSYNSFVASLETRLLPSARKLEELGADSNKQIPQSIKTPEDHPRDFKPPAPDESN